MVFSWENAANFLQLQQHIWKKSFCRFSLPKNSVENQKRPPSIWLYYAIAIILHSIAVARNKKQSSSGLERRLLSPILINDCAIVESCQFPQYTILEQHPLLLLECTKISDYSLPTFVRTTKSISYHHSCWHSIQVVQIQFHKFLIKIDTNQEK